EMAAQRLFNFKEAEVKAIRLDNAAGTLVFERQAPGQWRMRKPRDVRANDATIAFLLSQMTAAQEERQIEAKPEQKADFGLNQPQATVTVTLENGQTHQLIVGAMDFSGAFLYALVDPPADSAKTPELPVYVTTIDLQTATIRPLSEWLAPPPQNQSERKP
ncbi:MAG: DUF4340 domain-containing protein, partial [Gloeomargaritaceae cyanobacterium C42_A2020_066]|nr:DUF4340 domain-containing protein [Gloeomargaritaceae cyanobacterium C42_A2020_066]